METRKLRIWDGEINGGRLSVAQLPRIEHVGPYAETYEDLTVVIKANFPERQECRIGRIFKTVPNRVAVFKQTITSRDDEVPTDIVMGPDVDMDRTKLEVLEAWCTDPQHTDPPSRDAPCIVTEFKERDPTDEEKRIFDSIRRGPPTDADRQRWCEKEKANQRRAEAEEAMIRLDAKANVEPPANDKGQRKRSEAEKKAATEAHVKKTTNEAVNKEIVPIVEILKKAILANTPERDRQWWQNSRAVYDRESAPTEGAKWCAVAHIIVLCAKEESNKPLRDRRCIYLSKTMLNGLIKRLNTSGKNSKTIEDELALNLQHRVSREEKKTRT